MGKFRGFDVYYDGTSSQYSAKVQVAILFALLGVDATSDDLDALMAAYNFRTRGFAPDDKVKLLYERNKVIFQTVSIPDLQSMSKIPESTFWNSLGTIYNGTGNAGDHGKYGKFVWDNGYPCNNEDEGFRFFQVKCDGCSAVALQAGLGSTVWAIKSAGDVGAYDFHKNVLVVLRNKLRKLAKM